MNSVDELGDDFAAVRNVLLRYFDALHNSDSKLLGEIMHPNALYACATDGTLLHMDMGSYLPMVEKRPSPASKGEPRRDRIVAIEFAGPVTARATVECAIAPKHFTDFLTLVRLDGRWRIVAKVFHFELEQS